MKCATGRSAVQAMGEEMISTLVITIVFLATPAAAPAPYSDCVHSSLLQVQHLHIHLHTAECGASCDAH